MKNTVLFAAFVAVFALLAGCDKQPETAAPVGLVEVESIDIQPTLSLEPGGEKHLEAVVSPQNATYPECWVWESDNDAVANVHRASGLVRAAGVGTATITVTACSGKKASCVVTVALTDVIGQIPDPRFRAWCRKQIYLDETWDTDRDGKLSSDEAAQIRTLELPHGGTDWDAQITSLAGIEFFTGLRELICVGHRLAEIDLSRNTKLVSLLCRGNSLTSLDLSHNPDLYELQCDRNELTMLDVSNNPLLGRLTCADNRLSSLDVTGCDRLENLNCWKNQLSALDLSTCTALSRLQCSRNSLTALDLSKNVWLVQVECGSQWTLASLDVSKNKELIYLDCSWCGLKTIDVSGCEALDYFDCSRNELTSLDVSHNEYLSYLYCSYNRLTTLDVTSNSLWLKHLYCSANPGDGSVFPVTAWFDNNTVPEEFDYTPGWHCDGKKITVDFRKTK